MQICLLRTAYPGITDAVVKCPRGLSSGTEQEDWELDQWEGRWGWAVRYVWNSDRVCVWCSKSCRHTELQYHTSFQYRDWPRLVRTKACWFMSETKCDAFIRKEKIMTHSLENCCVGLTVVKKKNNWDLKRNRMILLNPASNAADQSFLSSCSHVPYYQIFCSCLV